MLEVSKQYNSIHSNRVLGFWDPVHVCSREGPLLESIYSYTVIILSFFFFRMFFNCCV